MLETATEFIPTKWDFVCGIITMSKNAAPMTILAMDPQCNCKMQEYQDFHSLTMVICDTSMISVNVRVLLREILSS